ncbi:hypothetical protein [Bordetella parapertussis]|uniref:hypothetical protein n=1 Tax=Bordetella parapertussis TaxID=519 RepID=UPI0013E8CDCA|nr:hypothetical protein [Bordetella parapertussis]
MVVRGRAVAGRVARQQRVAHRVGAQRRQRIVRGQGRRGGVGEHVRAAMRRVEQRQRVARRAADRGVAGRQMRQRIGGVARLRRIQVEGVRGGIGDAAHRQGAGAEQAAEYVLGRPGAGLPAPGRIGGRVRRRLGQRCRPCVGRPLTSSVCAPTRSVSPAWMARTAPGASAASLMCTAAMPLRLCRRQPCASARSAACTRHSWPGAAGRARQFSASRPSVPPGAWKSARRALAPGSGLRTISVSIMAWVRAREGRQPAGAARARS